MTITKEELRAREQELHDEFLAQSKGMHDISYLNWLFMKLIQAENERDHAKAALEAVGSQSAGDCESLLYALEEIQALCIGRTPAESTFSGANVLVLILAKIEAVLGKGVKPDSWRESIEKRVKELERMNMGDNR